MLCTFLFHFRMDGGRNLVSGQKLIDKAFALAVEQNCTLAAGGFGNQKMSAGLFTVKAGGVNLHIVHIFQLHAVFFRQTECIPRQGREVCRMFIQTADAARCQNCVFRMNPQDIAVFCLCNDAMAGVSLHQKVFHNGIVHNGDIRQCLYISEQRFCDFLPCDVLMEADTGLCVRAFSGIF